MQKLILVLLALACCTAQPISSNILGFYNSSVAFPNGTCEDLIPLEQLLPGEDVLIAFNGEVSWTAPYNTWVHFGNEISNSAQYRGCGSDKFASYIQVQVPETYDFPLENDREINVFIEQWTTGGIRVASPVLPIGFSKNDTNSRIAYGY